HLSRVPTVDLRLPRRPGRQSETRPARPANRRRPFRQRLPMVLPRRRREPAGSRYDERAAGRARPRRAGGQPLDRQRRTGKVECRTGATHPPHSGGTVAGNRHAGRGATYTADERKRQHEHMTLRTTALLLATVCLGAYGCTGRSEEPAVVAVDASDMERERTIRSVYIEMPDDVRLAADIWFPQGVDAGVRLPALVSFTRYWRARAFDPPMPDPPPIVEAANDAGYAVVIVDARGSGASFGSRASEFSTCETRDFRFVIDWIAAEAWSNGRVATFGVSYTGNTAEHATFDPAAALAAAVPRFTDFDAYKDILMPGGLRNTLISGEWGRGVRALDENRVPEGEWRSGSKDGARLLGVAPVGDGRLLAEAVTQHAANQDLVAWLSTFEYRDDLRLASGLGDDCDQIVSPYRFLHDADRPSIPAYHWGSWMDAGTAAGIIARFAAAPGH